MLLLDLAINYDVKANVPSLHLHKILNKICKYWITLQFDTLLNDSDGSRAAAPSSNEPSSGKGCFSQDLGRIFSKIQMEPEIQEFFFSHKI